MSREVTASAVPGVWLVGLAGGVASGKSTVAKVLAEQGCVVIDADQVAHEVLTRPEVVAELRSRFGDSVVNSAGAIDRPKMAALVFGDSPDAKSNRQVLESIVHPRVRAETEARIERLAGSQSIVILDIPLLFDVGWDQRCDRILFVDASRESRLARARARGWTDAQFMAREAAQLSVDEKRKRSTDVIANDGSLVELAVELKQLVEGWRSELGRK